MFFTDHSLHEVVKVDNEGIAIQIAGGRTFSGDGAPAQKARLTPRDVLITPDGRLLISDGPANRRIREVAGGVITTFAGVGYTPTSVGDGGPATAAGFIPNRITADAQGDVFLTDTMQLRPRRIRPDGIIESVGTNVTGATAGIAVNRAGDLLYVSQSQQYRVFVENFVDTAMTVAGLGSVEEPGTSGFSGDGGLATMAKLTSPQGLDVDHDGNLYICDLNAQRVRMVDAATGVITTIAGGGPDVFTGPTTGPATEVGVGFVFDCAVDAQGNVFFTGGNSTGVAGVWRLDRASNQVDLIAGGPDAEVPLTRLWAIDVDARGIVYLADEENGRIVGLIPDNLEGPYITGVITPGAFGAGDELAAGGWIEVFGYNLAPSTANWDDGFDGDKAPTTVNGTRLLVNGEESAVSYVSAGQVNGQAADGAFAENATIQIVNENGASNIFALTGASRAGTLLAPPSFAAGETQYVVAIFSDGAYMGPPGLIPGANFRRAAAGDTVVMYGVGFGDVTPPVPAGTVASGATALPNVTVRIGGQEARVVYAGLSPSSIGLYQFNIEIPEGVRGDVLLELTVDGVTVTQVLYVSVA